MPDVDVDQCEIGRSVILIFMAVTTKAVTCIPVSYLSLCHCDVIQNR